MLLTPSPAPRRRSRRDDDDIIITTVFCARTRVRTRVKCVCVCVCVWHARTSVRERASALLRQRLGVGSQRPPGVSPPAPLAPP